MKPLDERLAEWFGNDEKKNFYIWWRNNDGSEYIARNGERWFYGKDTPESPWKYHANNGTITPYTWLCSIRAVISEPNPPREYKLYPTMEELTRDWLAMLL